MGAAMTMIDSLDTLLIMNLDDEVHDARQWIAENLTFTRDHDRINVFESTIRLLGGLLSLQALTEDKIYGDKAEALGSVLMNAFREGSVYPHMDVNFATGKASTPGTSNIAEVGSIQLELNQLTNITGIEKYTIAGFRVQERLHSSEKVDGLLSIYLDIPEEKLIPSSRVSLGGKGDSYYEYLLKVWIQTGKVCPFLREDYINAIAGVEKRLVFRSAKKHLLYVAEFSQPDHYNHRMEHLTCFLPGTLALGVYHGMPKEHLHLAEELVRTCYEMYNRSVTGLAPEATNFFRPVNSNNDMQMVESPTNLLRPETMESLYLLYTVTKKTMYREWGKKIFEAFERVSKLSTGGYTGIENVMQKATTRMDRMESFWIAETLKYAYLLFNETAAAQFPLDRWVFNTEAHLLPITSDGDSHLSKLYKKMCSPRPNGARQS